MYNIPDPFKSIKREAWLAKSPGERLLEFLIPNDAYFKAIEVERETLRKISAKIKQQSQPLS